MLTSQHMQSHLEASRNVTDIQGLDNLRQAALTDEKGALKEAAKQFEGIFVRMMLKSMREASDVLADPDSPFNSQQVKFYRDMHDSQLANDLSTNGSIGMADLIVQQLGGDTENYMPAGLVRSGANLADFNQRSRNDLSKVQEQVLGPQPSKQQAFANPQEFVEALLPSAKQAAAKLGIQPQALIAQAAVETGWGKHMIHDAKGENSHNLFGIKAGGDWGGDKTVIDTLEYKGEVPQRQKAAFRSYGSFEQSLNDYVDFVKSSPRYADAVNNAADPKEYFTSLQKAGYATDPQYANKVMSVLKGKDINRAFGGDAN